MRRPRRLALSVAALGLAIAATGCTYANPVQTHVFYQAADGTNANLIAEGEESPSVGMRNAIVVVADDGSAELLGSVVNYTDETATVSLEGLDEGSQVFSVAVSVPAGDAVSLGSGEGQQAVAVTGLTAEPGDIIELDVSAGDLSTEISLPITDTSAKYYQDAEAGTEG
ncbi:hypothetical protein ACXET9_02015 [Brachybacterium sp. DNPG3]